MANSRKGNLPLTYVATTTPEQFSNKFDLAISQGFIYLIKDLKTHAGKIKQMLKPGGVYYTTYTDLNDNPSLKHFTEWINQNSLVSQMPIPWILLSKPLRRKDFWWKLSGAAPWVLLKFTPGKMGFCALLIK